MKIQPKQNRKTAFTLIELLVVIAIIAILAAILFPVFARARENARRSSCQSNMKQLGLSFMQYTQDYDEMLPLGAFDNSVTGTSEYFGAKWAGTIYSYVKSAQIYTCPSDTNRGNATNPTVVSYVYNRNLGQHYTGGGFADRQNIPSPKGRLSALQGPAKTVMLTELGGWRPVNPGAISIVRDITSPDEGSTFVGGQAQSLFTDGLDIRANFGNRGCCFVTGEMGGRSYVPVTTPADPNSSTAWDVDSWRSIRVGEDPRHLGGANFLMGDGHVKWFPGSKVSTGKNAANPSDAQEAGNVGTGMATAPRPRAAGTANDAFAVTFSAN